MNARLLLFKLGQILRERGVHGLLRAGVRYLVRPKTQDEFDARYGTDTAGLVPLWKFRIASPNARFGTRYQASAEQRLVDALSFLHEDLGRFTFIDLGCGKGRALLIAARLGCRRVVGVEFVSELVAVARANLARTGTANAAIIAGDAADFSFPDDDLLVYLNNPFAGEIVGNVIANLARTRANKLYVIYLEPACAALFDAAPFLRRFGSLPGQPALYVWTRSATEAAVD